MHDTRDNSPPLISKESVSSVRSNDILLSDHKTPRADEVSVVRYENSAIDDVYLRLLEIVRSAFSETGISGYGEAQLRRELLSRCKVYVLFRNNEVVGFSTLRTTAPNSQEAEVTITAIEPNYQRQGFVAPLMKEVEADLRRRGFKSIIREARTDNGWAAILMRHYGDRVIESAPCHGDGPPRMKIRVSLL